MPLSPEEQEKIRERIRRDLESSHDRGINPSDPDRIEQFSRDETRLQQIERIRREVEDEFYSKQPDYVQYVNRYGVSKWVLEEDLQQKRHKSRQRAAVKRQQRLNQVRVFLLYILGFISVYAGYRFYVYLHLPPVVMLQLSDLQNPDAQIAGNVMVFANNEITNLHPNKYGRLNAGVINLGVAASGYRTAFKKVEIKSKDTNLVNIGLIRDSSFQADMVGLWRKKFPPPNPDEPIVLTQLRSLSTSRQKSSVPRSVDTLVSSPIPATSGGVFITSNQPDATIYMNGSPTPLPQNTWLSDIPTGQVMFEVRKPGYRSNPLFQTTNRSKSSEKVSLAFELVAEHTAKVSIRTEPIIGEIKLDGVAVGRGGVEQEPAVGTHTISFGDVPNFITPPNQVVVINEHSGEQTIIGKYRASIDIEMKVDENGRIQSKGILNIQTGYWTEDKKAVPSQEYGPEIVKVKPYDFYVYQFGPGKPNSNPSGGDYLEITFNLPTGFDAGHSLSLVLEGYATNRNFQFNLTKLTEVAIEVNGQVSQANVRPSVNIDETRRVSRDAYPISRFLKAGGNRVLIRITDNSKCYYLLRGMKLE